MKKAIIILGLMLMATPVLAHPGAPAGGGRPPMGGNMGRPPMGTMGGGSHRSPMGAPMGGNMHRPPMGTLRQGLPIILQCHDQYHIDHFIIHHIYTHLTLIQ